MFSQENPKQKLDTLKVNELEEVVITATRTKRQLSSVPMPIILISKKQIQKSGSIRLRDILLEQTGIVMVSDFGNSEGVQLQGIAADYTLIMIDGVPIVGRTAGNIDLKRLTVNNIKQIEIVKGPSSSLYGSEAIGGVINIITEQPKRDVFKGNLQLFTREGARNEFDVNANIISKKDKFGLVAGINYNASKGFDLSPESIAKTTSPHQNFTGNLQLTYQFSKKVKTLLSTRFYNQEQNSELVDNSQTDWNVNLKTTHKILNNWHLDYTFYATRFKTESIESNTIYFFNRSLIRPEIRTKIDFNKSNFIAGIGGDIDGLDRTSFDGLKKYNELYVFAQYDFIPLKDLNLILGARFESSNKYQSALSPKISTAYKVNDWATVKTSVGYGFKAPDFRQLYFNFRNSAAGYVVFGTETLHDLYPQILDVNSIVRNLNPESSIGYNLGFQIKPIPQITFNVNFFRNDIKDLIDTFDTQLNPIDLELPAGTRVFTYRNIDEVYTQGVEIDFKYRISQNITLLGGYQFLDTGDKSHERRIKNGEIFFRRTPFSSSEQLTISNYFGLPNRSKHTGNLKLFYENYQHDFSINLRSIYRSKYALFDTNNSQGVIDIYDDFVSDNLQLNLSVEKTFFDLMNIQLGVDNLLNERGLENKVKFSNADNVLRLGRTFYTKIQFNF